MVYRILVSTYTNEVYTLSFDPEPHQSSLACVATTSVGFQPSWITYHPQDRSLVYACLEQDSGKIVLIQYANDGRGLILGEAITGGACPCFAVATSHELFVANYSSGSISTMPISAETPYFMEGISTTQLIGSGPNAERQESSHAHQVVLLEDRGELLVPDLGGDRVYIFRKNQSGKWAVFDHIQFPPGSGPRHVALHGGYLYTVLELTSQLARSSYPPNNKSSPLIIKSTMSKPPPFLNDMLAAEILIPPPNTSYPTPYVYVSNRNDPSPDGDTITIFSAEMELVGEVRTGLKHVRGMVFGGPDYTWLVVGGVHGGGVKIFERVDGGKALREIASDAGIVKPTGFLWL